MLVLSRQMGERIVIDLGGGREAVITYCGLRNGAARIGVQAPPDVRVDRGEVDDAIKKAGYDCRKGRA